MNRLIFNSLILIIVIGLVSFVNIQENINYQQQDNSKKFLAQFTNINPKNLHIYSPKETDPQGIINENKFEGEKIDSIFYKYFSSQLWFPDSKQIDVNIFGCYKFQFSDSLIGLIVRRRSQYSESAIDICLWNINSQKIESEFELADSYGDGGWFFIKDAWLTDLNNDGLLDIVIRKKESFMDTECDTCKDTKTDSVAVYIAHKNYFKQTHVSIDTEKYQLFNWKQ